MTASVTGTSRRTLLLNFRSAAAGTLATYVVGMAILPVVLDRVGSELYGAWVTIASLLAVGGLADIGIRTEIVRRVGAARGAGDDASLETSVHQGVSLLASLVALVIVAGLVAAPLVRGFIFPDGVPGYSAGEIDLLIRASLLLLAVTVLADAYFGVLRGLQRGDVETVATMAAGAVGTAVTVLGVLRGWGLWALFIGAVVDRLVGFSWQWLGVRRLVPFLRPRIVRVSRNAARAYLALSGLALLSQISEIVDSQWDKVMLSHFVGSAAVTSFQIGTSLVLQAKALALLPLAPLMVAVAELRTGEPHRMETLQRWLIKAAMTLGAVVLGGVYVYAPSFIRLWLGGQGSAGLAARLFVVAVAFNLLSAPLAFRAFGEGLHRLPAMGSVVNMVVNGTLSLLLTMTIGFNGALYGSIAGNIAGTAVFLASMRRALGPGWVRPPLGAVAVGSFAALLAVGLHLDQVGSWAGLVVSAGAYAVVVGSVCVAVERIPLLAVVGPAKDEIRAGRL